jgi:hypothetical protein
VLPLETFVYSLGYEPILSEKGDIAYTPDAPLDESCYREAAAADILVLIIGGRYGAERSDSRTTMPHTFYDRYDSITKQEYQSAISNNIPAYILVDTQVYAEYQTYLKNKGIDNVVYAHVDSINVFSLVEEILSQRRNNAMNTFSKYSEIEDWLREQWAGYFCELLKKTTESRQIASLSSQVDEMSELNKTLRTYLENMMPIVSPDSKKLIADETQRLDKLSVVTGNRFTKYLSEKLKLPLDSIVKLVDTTRDFYDFKKTLKSITSEEIYTLLLALLDREESARSSLNEARNKLGRKEFVFPPKDKQD